MAGIEARAASSPWAQQSGGGSDIVSSRTGTGDEFEEPALYEVGGGSGRIGGAFCGGRSRRLGLQGVVGQTTNVASRASTQARVAGPSFPCQGRRHPQRKR